MNNSLRYFRIVNTETGADLGIYGGETPDYAIRLMLDDAGCGPDEGADATIQAVEVEASTVSAADKALIERLRDENGWNE